MKFLCVILLSMACQVLASDGGLNELEALREDFYLYRQQTEDKISWLEDKLSQYEDRTGKRVLPETSVCGFTAYKNDNQNVESGNVVSFQNTLHNFQDAYDVNTNRFTCPTTAVYYVIVSLERSNDVETAVVMDGTRQFSIVDTRGQLTNLQFNSVTNSGLLLCEALNEIWVEATDRGEIFGSDQDNERVSSFTIFRLNYELPG